MNEMILSSNDGRMSSLEIANITGKEHKNIMRDIRNLLEQGVAALNFEPGTYKDLNQQDRPCYNVTKKGCLILASGYDAKLREKIIDRWEQLEIEKQTGGFKIPQSYSEALKLAATQAEQIEQQQKQIQQLHLLPVTVAFWHTKEIVNFAQNEGEKNWKILLNVRYAPHPETPKNQADHFPAFDKLFRLPEVYSLSAVEIRIG